MRYIFGNTHLFFGKQNSSLWQKLCFTWISKSHAHTVSEYKTFPLWFYTSLIFVTTDGAVTNLRHHRPPSADGLTLAAGPRGEHKNVIIIYSTKSSGLKRMELMQMHSFWLNGTKFCAHIIWAIPDGLYECSKLTNLHNFFLKYPIHYKTYNLWNCSTDFEKICVNRFSKTCTVSLKVTLKLHYFSKLIPKSLKYGYMWGEKQKHIFLVRFSRNVLFLKQKYWL